MDDATQQAVIFVGSIVGVSATLALALRTLTRFRIDPAIDAPDDVSVSDAAKFAYGQLSAEHRAIARVAEQGSGGVLAWFENSIRKWLSCGSNNVKRGELRRYIKWARTVQ